MTRAGRRTAAGSDRPRRFSLGPSLQRRVGRFTLLMVALAVLVVGLGGYLATRITVDNAVDRKLAGVCEDAMRSLGPAPDATTIDAYLTRAEDVDDDLAVAIIGADGQVRRAPGSAVIALDPRDLGVAAGLSSTTIHEARSSTGAAYRVQVVPVGDRPGLALQAARPLATAQSILGTLAVALAGCAAVAVVGAGLVALRVARASVAPVRELTGEVERRAAADDLEPVRVGRNDEIGRLAVAFNHLLDTVKVSRTRQARFVADAGHELRTPLTSLRTNIELLAVDTEHGLLRPADRLIIIRDVQAQLVEFSTLVSDLIGLTREDRAAADFGEVDLTTVLDEAIDRVSAQAVGLRWDVELEATTLHGDADLLARAFVNVLENAAKFSPERGTVTVTLHDGEVRIGDEGRGVSVEERPFVFDRFFRSEASRATPGTGLGLSITESVVRQHGGTVAVTDAPGGGALFVLTFPLAVVHRRTDPGSGRGPSTGDPRLAVGGAEA